MQQACNSSQICPLLSSSKVCGLLDTSSLTQLMTDQLDQSIEVVDSDFGRQLCGGTLRHLLDAIRSDSGPILNALSFPLSLSGVKESPMSTEIEAWRLTEGLKFCPNAVNFPVGQMRWGLAATRGARRWAHIDSDGLGTFIDVQCGAKWWITFSPPPTRGRHALGSILEHLGDIDSEYLTIREKIEDHWVAEALYLTPGTRL